MGLIPQAMAREELERKEAELLKHQNHPGTQSESKAVEMTSVTMKVRQRSESISSPRQSRKGMFMLLFWSVGHN